MEQYPRVAQEFIPSVGPHAANILDLPFLEVRLHVLVEVTLILDYSCQDKPRIQCPSNLYRLLGPLVLVNPPVVEKVIALGFGVEGEAAGIDAMVHRGDIIEHG